MVIPRKVLDCTNNFSVGDHVVLFYGDSEYGREALSSKPFSLKLNIMVD